jgi:hypothetical protein
MAVVRKTTKLEEMPNCQTALWVSVTQSQGNNPPGQKIKLSDYFAAGGQPVPKVWFKLPAHLLA